MSSSRPWPPRGGWLALDGLRGVAILLVICVHYLGAEARAPLHPPLLFRLARAGWMGVDLFFVLSGFLITGILLDTRDDPHHFRNFYARRTLRIFPLYYLTLFLVFVVGAHVPGLDSPAFRHMANHQVWLWLYASNIKAAISHSSWMFGPLGGGWIVLSHMWSLAVEEQFYLVWPAVLYLTPHRWRPAMAGAVFAGALLLRLCFLAKGNGLAAYMLMPCRMDALAAGALAAILLRRDGGFERLLRWARPAVWGAGAVLAGYWLWHGDLWYHDPRVQGPGYSLVAVLGFGLVVLAAGLPATHPFVRVLSLGWLRSIGRVSYAMYIFHFALLKLVFRPLTPVQLWEPWLGSPWRVIALRFVLVLLISWALALLSWRLWEQPFLRLKRYFGGLERGGGSRT